MVNQHNENYEYNDGDKNENTFLDTKLGRQPKGSHAKQAMAFNDRQGPKVGLAEIFRKRAPTLKWLFIRRSGLLDCADAALTQVCFLLSISSLYTRLLIAA